MQEQNSEHNMSVSQEYALFHPFFAEAYNIEQFQFGRFFLQWESDITETLPTVRILAKYGGGGVEPFGGKLSLPPPSPCAQNKSSWFIVF